MDIDKTKIFENYAAEVVHRICHLIQNFSQGICTSSWVTLLNEYGLLFDWNKTSGTEKIKECVLVGKNGKRYGAAPEELKRKKVRAKK